MKIIMNVFNFFIDAGPTVMLPVIITIIGLIFGLKITRAFKSGLTLGIGFAGIKLILDFMTTNVGPAAKAMVERTGVKLDALDVGWGSIAAVTWASPIIPILIFAILLVNIVLLVLKRTHTLDVDIWNYHHMAIVGVMVYFVTKNVFLGVGASVVMAIVTFKISDWSQPMVESFFGIPGVSLPTVSALSSLVIAWPLNWLLDRIPLFRKSKFTIKDAQKYLGFFGDSMIMGLVIGMVIGALAGYDIKAVLQLGVSMSAVLVLIPKMTSLFMEGLMPISDAAQKWSQEKFKGTRLFIGLDAAVVVGIRCYYNSIDHYSFNNRHGLSLARKPRFTICRFGRCAFPGSDGGCLDSREFVEKHRDRFSHYCFIAMVWFCNIPNVDSNC